jgi:hypothetical protein
LEKETIVPFAHRESWLAAVAEHFKPDFTAHGYPMPERLRITCGWPSKGALALKARRIGECWHPKDSADGAVEIFISPFLADPVEVETTLVHELVHAAVGNECGHKGPFKWLALQLGLEGPMRSTPAGTQLIVRLNVLCNQLGPYPHAALNGNASDRKKQSTRLLKAECLMCGYTIRITQKWVDKVDRLPICPAPSETHSETRLTLTKP